MYRRTLQRIMLLSFACVCACAQAPNALITPAFEVASVKSTSTSDGSLTWDIQPGGRFIARNLTLHMLIRIAYSVEDYQISGADKWMSSTGFDIDARPNADAAPPKHDTELAMLRALLADRFGLVVHNEERETQGYGLVVGKAGPRLRAADGEARENQMRMGHLVVRRMTMASLASILTFDLKRPVRDETGLAGEFAFALEWERVNAPESAASTAPSLFTAVKEQLGLELTSKKMAIQTVVVNRARIPADN